MKKNFITGIIALLPIGITILIIWVAIMKLGAILDFIFEKIPGLQNLPKSLITFMGFIALIIIIYLIGVIVSTYVGKKLFSFGEKILERVPLIRPIYLSARKFTDAVFLEKASFKKTVLVEFPRKGIWSLAFMTQEKGPHINGKESVSVFLPTTPNPTTGYFLVIPRSQIKEIDMTIDEALKAIISSGVIAPEEKKWQVKKKQKKSANLGSKK